MKKTVSIISGSAIMVTPFVAFAQSTGVRDLNSLVNLFGSTLNVITSAIISLAVIFFLFGVFKFVSAGGDPEKRAEGRNTMIYGIIAIFVMVSVWGLVRVLKNTFNLQDTGTESGPTLPTIPGLRS